MGNKDQSGNAALTHRLQIQREELQSWVVLTAPSWVLPAYTSFNSQIDEAEERISEIEDQLNKIKQQGKNREKRVKIKEQILQEIWDYVKRPNLDWIRVPKCDGENESKLENTLQDILQENFPNLAS